MFVNLKICLWQSGLRQNRLAQALQMDEALLSRIINGFREPTPEQRTSIAEILHRDETWLFARDFEASTAAGLDRGQGAPGERTEAIAPNDGGQDDAALPNDHPQV